MQGHTEERGNPSVPRRQAGGAMEMYLAGAVFIYIYPPLHCTALSHCLTVCLSCRA